MNNKNARDQRGDARVRLPQRHQVEMHFLSLDEMIREDHLARTVVNYVDTLDLSDLYREIKATRCNAGRNALDPRMLFSLWLFATLEGENSGRRIAKLTKRDLAYMWICGGVSVNYHSICDFRTQHSQLLEQILTDSVSILQYHGLIELRCVAQDGMRVRANAGSGSFRRQKSLEEARAAAETYLQQLDSQPDPSDQSDDQDDNETPPNKGQQSARARASAERALRLEEACRQMEELQSRYTDRNANRKPEDRPSAPRVSTTDPEARRMKMGDNGTRPAFNVQFATDADSLVTVSVDVTNEGTDSALLAPRYDDVCQRYDVVPESYLADGGFSKKAGVCHVENSGTKFYGPLFKEKSQLAAGKDPYAARYWENATYTAFRERMGTDEAKAMYRRRSAAAEFPNAVCRNQGLSQFSVRGLLKARAETLWHVLAHNFRRYMNLTKDDTKQTYLDVLMTS
jgi:transposase